jgi:2,3-bisphosphoglycerate-dependent phosphoglycerate mutase
VSGPGRAFRLVLLRHGESTWNAQNLFTGWVNVPLSPDGEQQARRAGRLLASAGLRPALVHTSMQRRAIHTADLVLAECDRDWIPLRRSWRLNSNHYGALQGRDKDQVRGHSRRGQASHGVTFATCPRASCRTGTTRSCPIC